MKKIIPLLLILFLFSSNKKFKEKTIYIQPLGNVNKEYLDFLKKEVNAFYGYECVINSKIELTEDIETVVKKNRLNADKILKKFNSTKNLLIITEKDITHKKNNEFPEWGIFSLGYRPGSTCVISTSRLKNNVTKQKMLERLKKVALHEIGHNLGLPHCTNDKECMMSDADGTIAQVDREKIRFCSQCWNKLK